MYLLFFLLVVYTGYRLRFPVFGQKTQIFKGMFNFPDIWHNFTYVASWFNLLLGILVIILVTNEFYFRTARQNIIDGLSRKQFLFAKVQLICILAFLVTFFIILTGLIFGFSFSRSPSASAVFDKADFVIGYFFQSAGYMLFALFTGILIRRSGLAVCLFLLYLMIVEPIIAFNLYPPARDFLPMNAIAGIIQNPYKGMIGLSSQSTALNIQLLYAVIYSYLFIVASNFVLKKRDL